MRRKTTRRWATGPPPPLRVPAGNPADDRGFRTAILAQADRLAGDIILATPTGDRHRDDERRHRAAAMWRYLSAVAVSAEDHHARMRPALARLPGAGYGLADIHGLLGKGSSP